MQKIPTVYLRDYSTKPPAFTVIDPDCQWVLDGEGVATVKYDGTCCLVDRGILHRRHKLKEGDTLEGWFHWRLFNPSPSGHGWVPVGEGPADRWHREPKGIWQDGTYELVGPKIQKNPYKLEAHELWEHGSPIHPFNPRTLEEMKEYLTEVHSEGIVWHHPDGRMAKIKSRDFGIRWPKK